MNLAAALSLTEEPLRYETVAVDFDGTLAEHMAPFNPRVAGEPLAHGLGLVRALMNDGFHVVIFTARQELGPVKVFFEQHGFPGIEVTNVKPVAIAYLDDRAIPYRGNETYGVLLKRIEKLRQKYLSQ